MAKLNNENINDIKDDETLIKEQINNGSMKATIMDHFSDIYIVILKYMMGVGLTTIKVLKKISKILNFVYDKFLQHHIQKIQHKLLKGLKWVFKGVRYVTFKIHMFNKFIIDAINVVKKGYNYKKNNNVFVRIGFALKAFRKGVKNNKSIFATWFNYLLPAVSIIGLCLVVNYVSSLKFAVSVEYNGENIGYIENETVFEQAEAKLQERMTYLDDEETINNLPKFSLAVATDKKLKNQLELTDSIIKSSNEDIVMATGLSIDGKFYGAVKDGEKLNAKLEAKKEKYKTTDKNQEVKFAKDVNLETGLFVAKNIKPDDEILKMIDRVDDKDVFDQIVENDTPIIIATRNDMTLDELVKLNPSIMESCVIGKSVLVKKSQPFLPVSVVSTETYSVSTAYDKKVTESTKYYKGYSTVTKKGQNGEKVVTAKIERVDGTEVRREILSTNVVKEPVTEQITKGVGAFPDATPYTGKISNSGFSWPVSGAYVSSYYGYRGRAFHTGVDLAFRGNGYGAPIRAALSGKVISTGWGGSYGNLTKIDHGGGVQTWYAHASRILVKPGQIVSQGQVIARVGSTGRSTGNHLHFEVRFNGATQNPLKYLP